MLLNAFILSIAATISFPKKQTECGATELWSQLARGYATCCRVACVPHNPWDTRQ